MIIFVWLAVGWTLLSFFISPLLGALFQITAGTKPARIIEEVPKRDPLEVQAAQVQELPMRSPLIIVPEPEPAAMGKVLDGWARAHTPLVPLGN